MKNKKRIIGGIFIIVTISIIIFGLIRLNQDNDIKSDVTNKEPKIIKIGYLPYSSALPFFYAMEMSLFGKKGLNIESVKLASSNEAVDSLITGHLDFVVGIGLSTFFAVEGASPGSIKIFQPCVEDKTHIISYLLTPKSSNLKYISELKGKRVGTYSGTSQVLVLRLLLFKIGLNPDNPEDVKIGDVDSNIQIDALAAGQFDAFLMIEPYATKAIYTYGCKPIVVGPRTKYIMDPFPAGGNAVSSKFLRSQPENTQKVVNVLDEAIEGIHHNEAFAKTILPKYDKTLTLEVANKTGLYHWWTKDETEINMIQKYADFLYIGHAIKKQVKLKNMFLK